jgi:hypothetical protein
VPPPATQLSTDLWPIKSEKSIVLPLVAVGR